MFPAGSFCTIALMAVAITDVLPFTVMSTLPFEAAISTLDVPFAICD